MVDDTDIPLTDPESAPVTFINDVAGIGFLNGVLNVTLSTSRFTPDGSKVNIDRVVASRLRMDLFCAQQLHEQLGKIIEQHTKGPAQPTAKPN